MNIKSLTDWMKKECFNEHSYGIGDDFKVTDGNGLMQEGEEYVWYYVERGRVEILERFNNEADACQFAFEQMKSNKTARTHLVGFLTQERFKEEFCQELKDRKIEFENDKIPYLKGVDKHRIFVFGCDHKKVVDLKEKYETLEEKIYKNSIVIQGFPYDEKSSFLKGAKLAPLLIRQFYHSESTNYFAENGVDTYSKFVIDEGDFEINTYFGIESVTKAHLSENSKLITLGGDHSITFPVIKALSKFYPKIDILHFDAHPDLYDELDGDKNSHACPFARIMEHKLAKRLVQVGIRTMNSHQLEQAEKFGVEVHEMRNLDISKIPKFENPVYISLDMDAFDPAFAPGVSHHEPGGMTSRQVIEIIQNIDQTIIGADIVEYNPTRDVQDITGALAAKCLKEILGKMVLEQNKLGLTEADFSPLNWRVRRALGKDSFKDLTEILVSKESFESEEPYDLVYSNIKVINLIRGEGYFPELITTEALESYYADYFLAQVNNGGFSQFVYNSRWDSNIIEKIESGLMKMKAKKYLKYFQEQSKLVEKLDKKTLEDFFDNEYFGENPTRDLLNDDSFYKIKDDLILLNHQFLKSQPNLKVLTGDEMFEYLENILGKKLKRN